jgi:predicted nucleic acid-binding protein
LRRNRPGPGAGRDASDRLFVDSSAWIALLSARDRHHAEADAMFRRAAAQRVRLLTTNLVLAEVHRLLLLRTGARSAARALDRFEASPLTIVEFATAEHHRAARVWLERLRGRPVTYTDAVSFAVMEATRCAAAMSFDRDFARAGFALWRGRLPEPSAGVAAARPWRSRTR